MPTYKYATKEGGLKEFEAQDSSSALAMSAGFSDANSSSGVQEVKAPTPVPTPEPTSSVDTAIQPTSKTRVSRTVKVQEEEPFKAQSVDDIQEVLMKSAQAQINSLNAYYQGQVQEQQEINKSNDRSTASISTLTGLAGSTEANVAQQKTTAEGQKAVKRIQDEAQLQIQTILGNVRKSALDEARLQREEARMDEATRLETRKMRQEEAVSQLTNLTASGVTFDGLKEGDPDSFKYLVDKFGGEDQLKGAFVLNTPQDQVLDKKIEGGKYIVATQNPVTGKISVQTLDLGLPPLYTKTIDAGNRILAIPDGWSGDPSELISINKGVSPSSGGGSSNQSIDNERALMSQFRGEPIVKTYNEVLNKKLSVDRILENGVGGPTDLALVFEFMKALDPSSVVRETEYSTAAKSGNIFAGAYAKFNGYFKPEGGFLPESVKLEFQNLTNQKLAVAQQLYDNTAQEYIDVATRQGLDARNVVINYQNALNNTDGDSPSPTTQKFTITDPKTGRKLTGQVIETQEDYDDAIRQGYEITEE